MRHSRDCFNANVNNVVVSGAAWQWRCRMRWSTGEGAGRTERRAERGEARVQCEVEAGCPRSTVSRTLSPDAVCVSVLVNVVLLEFTVQSRPVDAQRVRGARDVVAGGFEGHVQGLPFDLLE